MSYEIDPKEVLIYLNELGYTNISPNQLKQFIKDLKKLIKYDQRQENFNKENISSSTSHVNSKCSHVNSNYSHVNSNYSHVNSNCTPPLSPQTHNSDVFTALHNTSTAASRAKVVQKKESIISVQINRPISHKIHENTCPSDRSNEPFSHTCPTTLTDVNDKRSNESESKLRTKSTSSAKGFKLSEENRLKPKSSFIRPRQQQKLGKSDPVALYHRYQEEWKRMKIPGMDNRANLRWAIREKMLGGPHMR